MAKFRTVSRKGASLGSFTLYACLPLTICLGSAAPGMAQSYGRAAQFNITPSIPELKENYQIDNPVQCPSPRFSIGGFAGNGNDRATLNDPYLNNTSSINQYGVAAGISIPFGSGLSGFCEELAKQKLEFERTRTENQRRNAQLALIEQCYWLKTSGFMNDENEKIFNENDEFASLRPCFKINLVRDTATIPNLQGVPPKADVEPSSPPPTIIQDDRRRN